MMFWMKVKKLNFCKIIQPIVKKTMNYIQLNSFNKTKATTKTL